MKIFLISVLALSGIYFYNMQPVIADYAIVTDAKPTLTEKAKTYKVDTSLSAVMWTGTKPSGKHEGIIKIVSGIIEVDKDQIKSGNFTIDMNTITDTDLAGRGKEGLEKHLKGADFFNVEKFPSAQFEITGVQTATANEPLLQGATHTLSGNFTMLGITKNISFPAIVAVDKNKITAKADFNIDRTLWGMNYGADGKVGKDINIKLDITATK